MTTIDNQDGWRLENLDIRFNNWGDYKDKYTGTIKFQNKQNEAFVFNLSPEEITQYVALIKDKVTNAGARLGERLIQSLNVLVAPVEQKSIGKK